MTQLTEEELELQKKYALLRKHKKILSDLKKQRKEALKSNNADGSNKVSATTTSGPKKAPKEESKSKTTSAPSSSDTQKKTAPGNKTTGKPEETEKTAEQRKEEAKRLVAKGLIKINPNERKKQEFKRSRNLERRLEDPDKSVNAPVEYTPFSAASEKDAASEKETTSNYAGMKRKMASYDNFFVKSGERREREETTDEDEADLRRRLEARDRERESEKRKRGSASASGGGEDHAAATAAPTPSSSSSKKGAIHRDDLEGRGEERKRKQKGNTVFVKGHGLNEEIVRSAFDRFGKILNVKMDSDNRNNWFVTYLEQPDAATAIRQMDNTMVSEIHLHVALARHQVDISTFIKDANVGGALAGSGKDEDKDASNNRKAQDWTSMASSTNHKSEHEDKRNLITYDIDDEFD